MTSIADDTQWLDATATAELVASGEVSAPEMVDAAIERIEKLDGPLNAVTIKWYDHARAVAEQPTAGPFAGVPFLLKDLWAHYEGQTMTNGNVALRDAAIPATADTTLVSRFRAAGLQTLGRTNSPELGSLPVTEPVANGPTRNPYDTDRTPGGSSGGAAAAVAVGMVPIAHASDGGGSIRIPASCCGLVGLKPSQGRITMGPQRAESNLGIDFCVSRTVRDTASLLDAVHGPGVGDTVIAAPPARPYLDEIGVDPGRLRIGLMDTLPDGSELHADCVTAVRNTAAVLESLGHDVSIGHPATLDDQSFRPRFMAMWAANMAGGIATMGSMIGRELTEDEVEPVNWAQAQYASKVNGVEYLQALNAVIEFRRGTQQWWEDGWDLLLSPTLNEPPVKIGDHDPKPGDPMAGMKRAAEFISFTPPFNASGQPAISLPLHWNEAGLPIGVQLAAAYGREDLLIQVSSQLEMAAPWSDRRPPV